MAYNNNSCVASLSNTGLSGCLDNLGYDARLIWTPLSFEIDTETNAKLQATWTDGIDAKNIYPFPIHDEIEPAIEDNVEEDLPTGVSLFVREGKYGGIGRFQGALCDIIKLRTFNNVSGRAFIITNDGSIWGTSPDGTKLKGFLLSKLFFTGLGGSDGSTTRKFSMYYQFKNPSELFDYAAAILHGNLSWSPLDLVGLMDVTVAVESSAAGSVTVSVTKDCDGEAIDGLVVGDFTMLASDGTTEMLPGDGFADNGDGTYTFTFTTPVLPADTYTVNLKTPTTQTTGGYEAGTADSFVIS